MIKILKWIVVGVVGLVLSPFLITFSPFILIISLIGLWLFSKKKPNPRWKKYSKYTSIFSSIGIVVLVAVLVTTSPEDLEAIEQERIAEQAEKEQQQEEEKRQQALEEQEQSEQEVAKQREAEEQKAEDEAQAEREAAKLQETEEQEQKEQEQKEQEQREQEEQEQEQQEAEQANAEEENETSEEKNQVTEDDVISHFDNIGEEIFDDSYIGTEVHWDYTNAEYYENSDLNPEETTIGRVNVEVELGDILTVGFARNRIFIEMTEYLENIQNEDFNEVYIGYQGSLIDNYGNERQAEVASATFTKDTVDQINFENFQYDNIPQVADSISLHQDLQE